MALRAGYYGIKRGLKDKLVEIVGTWDQVKNEVDGIIANTGLIKDTVGWSGKNEMPPNVVELGTNGGAIGSDTFKSATVTSFIAPLNHNTNYIISREGGDRFRVALSNDYPVVGGSCNIIASDNSLDEYSFNSENYNYVWFLTNITVTDVSTIKPMLRKANILDDTYEPYRGTTAFPRDEQAVLGAKNLLENTGTSQTKNGVTFTVNADKSVSVNGTATANTEFYLTSSKTGAKWKEILGSKVIMTGCAENGSASTYYIRIIRTNPSWQDFGSDYGTGRTLDISSMDNDATYLFLIGISNGVTINNLVFKPMLRLATDPDDTYVPYAMTNKELTDSAADQKTAINAIITAATGAADFAAFKTAMGAITPVTRSLLLTKEDITEEVKEDVEPKKTVTKKRTTKKTEEV